MPATDRRLELKEKSSMAQNALQAFVYANGLEYTDLLLLLFVIIIIIINYNNNYIMKSSVICTPCRILCGW